MLIDDNSVLFVTLDSCRYDTFVAAHAPAMKSISPTYKAQAASHFTYASHAAMFVGFTPGLPDSDKRFLNPKLGRLFRLERAGWQGRDLPGFEVSGRGIVNGFHNAGYTTLGTASAGWFNPDTEVSRPLIDGFEHFYFAGHDGVRRQVGWIDERIAASRTSKIFAFLNLGETHVPYHYIGAPWPAEDNPCVPFQNVDRSEDCRVRQRLCCEYIDVVLVPLIERFKHATILICSDHGDCWGEDGLWEHGISHPMTLTVPLLIRYRGAPYHA